MALYKYEQFLRKSDSPAFDHIHAPGARAPNSGIYRCEGCGKENACNKDEPLPPQNHHQHAPAQGQIRWRLIVFAE